MGAALNGNELLLIGDVGDFGDQFDHFTHSQVIQQLAQISDAAALMVRINSGGGFASEGAAIYATLGRRRGRTDVTIEGIAASAASLIAMAGDTVTMTLGSTMMIHDPSGLSIGTADDHQNAASGLDTLGEAYATVYAVKSGKTVTECRAIMKAETWFTPEEAVVAGFADAIERKSGKPVAAFDYRKYMRAPESLKAMASAKGWTQRASAPPLPTPLRVDIVANARRRQEERDAGEKAKARMLTMVGAKPAEIKDDPTLKVDIVANARRRYATQEQAEASQKAEASMRRTLSGMNGNRGA